MSKEQPEDDALLDIPWDEVNPMVVDFALNNLTPHERAALNLIHRDELSVEQAAGFLRLSPEEFTQLFTRARRRLRREYRRLIGEGPLVAFPPLAWAMSAGRRLRMVSMRSCASVDTRVAPGTVEALVSSVAAVVLVSTAAAVGGGVVGTQQASPVRPRSPVVQHAVAVSAEPAVLPARPSAAAAQVSRSAPSSSPEGRSVGVAIGPIDKPSTHQDDETVYGVEITPPVSVPEEPETGIEDGPYGVGVGYECPAEPRPLVLAVACPVLEP